MTRTLLLLLIMISSSACNPAIKSFVASRKDEDTSKSKNNSANDEEKVDVPNNIAGSYLMCSLRKDATTTDVSSEYGCRLNEEGTMNKLDLSAYLSRIQWKSNLDQGISITANPQNSVWHALYRLSAADVPSLRDAAARLQIQVQWNALDGTPITTFKDQKVVEILQPADVAGDTTAPILQPQGLDPNDPGTL